MPDDETPAKIKINGTEYELPKDYTLAETVIFERMTGKSMAEIDFGSATALSALVYVTLRRADPATREDVLDLIRLEDVQPVEDEEVDERPPVEDGAGPEMEETPVVSGVPN